MAAYVYFIDEKQCTRIASELQEEHQSGTPRELTVKTLDARQVLCFLARLKFVEGSNLTTAPFDQSQAKEGLETAHRHDTGEAALPANDEAKTESAPKTEARQRRTEHAGRMSTQSSHMPCKDARDTRVAYAIDDQRLHTLRQMLAGGNFNDCSFLPVRSGQHGASTNLRISSLRLFELQRTQRLAKRHS